jgi:hypothetical protein
MNDCRRHMLSALGAVIFILLALGSSEPPSPAKTDVASQVTCLAFCGPRET